MEDISRLTIPKLKALCKEKKLTGYSKLNKPGLIAKLLEHQSLSDGTGNSNTTAAAPSQPKSGLVTRPIAREPLAASAPSLARLSETSDTVLRPVMNPSSQLFQNQLTPDHATQTTGRDSEQSVAHIAKPITPFTGPARIQDPAAALKSTSIPSGSFRLAPEELPSEVAPKAVKRIAHAPIEAPKAKRPKFVTAPLEPASSSKNPTPSRPDPRPAKAAMPQAKSAEKVFQDSQPTVSGHPVSLKAKRKVFAPLIPAIPPVTSIGNSSAVAMSVRDTVPCTSDAGVSDTSFEFLSDDTPIALRPVTLPPSISQRKKVQRLSAVFSLLYERDLAMLCTLCRLYRYSAYISASHILRRDFAGPRLDAMFKKYSPNMADYWPYLRRRKAEANARKQQFLSTFLGKSLATFPGIISHRMWACDNTKYLLVAAKFLLTSFFYRVSIGLNVPFGTMTLLSVEEVVQGEIWKISANLDGERRIYYVLEATCEVIGLPSLSNHGPEISVGPTRGRAFIRADWTEYIESKLHSENRLNQETLQDRLTWPNHEEYDHGISKVWTDRVKREWETGLVKLVIARRYVLACLVANSLSGRHLTSMEMEQEFNGRSGDGVVHIRRAKQKQILNLYLPSHHLVESVHIMNRGSVPLHPAVATVQTLGREYYILRDNGLQIGTEEDGISEVWMGILGCNLEGVAL